jgi:hypothetical protein
MESATSFDFYPHPAATAAPPKARTQTKTMPPHDHSFMISAAIGAAASVIGVITTFQQEIEWWVRITGGVVTIGIGILSIIHMIRKLAPHPAKRHRYEDEDDAGEDY